MHLRFITRYGSYEFLKEEDNEGLGKFAFLSSFLTVTDRLKQSLFLKNSYEQNVTNMAPRIMNGLHMPQDVLCKHLCSTRGSRMAVTIA